jgi:hypothetical protein
MIGKEEFNEEEPVLKVLDRRKFNSDGSVREGVQLEAEKPKQQPKTAEPIDEPTTETVQTYGNAPLSAADEKTFAETDETEEFDASDIPGADDPASFVNFLTTLASQAAAALGAIPNPATGQRTLDLETGKYWIDVLAMLKEKTRSNLHAKEQELFDGILSDLRMQYVQIQRIAEEQLKQQAAQKFSASDILGKK